MDGWLQAVGNLLLGLVGGGIAGALVTNYLQTKGEIVVRASRWKADSRGIYSFHLNVYNSTAMPDGLENCRVVFSKAGKELFTDRVRQENALGRHEMVFEDKSIPFEPLLEVIELPPRTPVHIGVHGPEDDIDEEVTRETDRVEFVAFSPTKGEICTTIPVKSSTVFPAPDSPATDGQRS